MHKNQLTQADPRDALYHTLLDALDAKFEINKRRSLIVDNAWRAKV